MELSPETVRRDMRRRYERVAALLIDEGSGTVAADPVFLESGQDFGSALYSAGERRQVPVAALAASLGCGSPTAGGGLRPGDRVLDLGCGGGIDVLLAAQAVGEHGLVIGLDLTHAMLDLARANALRAGRRNVRLVAGVMECLPFRAETFDAVISNCSINLASDKGAVLAEASRVLRAGKKIHLSDVVAEDSLTIPERLERAHQTGCTVGALSHSEYIELLERAGFGEVNIRFSHSVADRMAAVRISARLY